MSASYEPASFEELTSSALTPKQIQGMVVKIAQEQGVNPDLALRIARQESGFNPMAISKQGARGVMQLMPATAADMGVEDVHDPFQNITGGVKYIALLDKRFQGDEAKVRAAYHSGPETVATGGLEALGPKGRDYVEKTAPNRGSQIASELKAKKAATYEPMTFGDQPTGKVTYEPMFPEEPKPEKAPEGDRGVVGEIWMGGKRSAFGQFPQQIGQALKWIGEEPKSWQQGGLGSTTYEIGQSLQNVGEEYLNKPANALHPESHNWMTNALASGAEMVVPSVAPMAIAALLPATLPAWVSMGIGATSMSWMYGGQQAQQTYERGIAAGLSKEEARRAGIETGAIEAGGEILGTIALGYMFGMVGKGISKLSGMNPVDGVFAAVKNPAYFKDFVKKLPGVYGTEIGTEIGQNWGEAKVEEMHGIPQGAAGTPWEQGKMAIAPTFGMTTLMLPFGLIGHAMDAKQTTIAGAALEDPKAPPQVRKASAESIYAALKAEDKTFAEAWITKAREAIAAGQPVGLDRQFVQAAGKPAPPAVPPPQAVPTGGAAESAAVDTMPTRAGADLPLLYPGSPTYEHGNGIPPEGGGTGGGGGYPNIDSEGRKYRDFVSGGVQYDSEVVSPFFPNRVYSPDTPIEPNFRPANAQATPISPIDQARVDVQTLKSGQDLGLPPADQRVINARLLSVYGENAAVRHVIEAPDQFQNIAQAMLLAAPMVERVRGTIANNERSRDVTDDLLGAVDEIAKIKESGKSVAQVLAEGVSHDISFEGQQLMQFLDENAGNPQRIAGFIESYLQQVEDATGVPSEVRGRAFDIIQERAEAKRKAEEKRQGEVKEKDFQKAETVAKREKAETTIKATEQESAERVLRAIAVAKAAGSGINPEHVTAIELAFKNAKPLKGKPNGKPSAETAGNVQGPPSGGNQAGPGQNEAEGGKGAVPGPAEAGDQGNARPIREGGNQPGAEAAKQGAVNRGVQIAAELGKPGTGEGTRANPVIASHPEHIAQAAERAEAQPSSAQKTADNYRKGHFTFAEDNPLAKLGVISIETAKGAERTAHDGTWTVPNMPAHYGHLQIAEGKDGDKADVFIGEYPKAPRVYVIDQINPDTGKYDETKSMLGFLNPESARKAYVKSFSDGKGEARIGAMTEMTPAQFVARAQTGGLKNAVAYKQAEAPKVPERAAQIKAELARPDLTQIMVKTEAIEAETGKRIEITERADKALAGIDHEIQVMKELAGCLG